MPSNTTTTIPKNAKKPQDRKPKDVIEDLKSEADGPGPFTFEANDQTYTLPPASDGLLQLDGGDLMDALENDEGEVRLGIRVLRLCNVEPDTMTALRSLKLQNFSEVVGDWFRSTGQLGE